MGENKSEKKKKKKKVLDEKEILRFNQIITGWSSLDRTRKMKGLKGVANKISGIYFYPLAYELEKKYYELDRFRSLDIASEVIYDLIKNNYKTLQKIDRDKGSLRAFLRKIMKDKMKMERRKKKEVTGYFFEDEYIDSWADFTFDFEEALNKLKEKNPIFYEVFYLHHVENRKKVEVAKILNITRSMVDNRLEQAEGILKDILSDYGNLNG